MQPPRKYRYGVELSLILLAVVIAAYLVFGCNPRAYPSSRPKFPPQYETGR